MAGELALYREPTEMFLPKYLVDKVASGTEAGLNRILAAKDEQCAAVVKAKDEQIKVLQSQVDYFLRLIDHERSRAEAAIDALLQAKANVAGIRNADLARESALKAEKDGAPVADPRLSEMQKVFQSIAGVGDDAAETDEDRREAATSRFETIGGLPCH